MGKKFELSILIDPTKTIDGAVGGYVARTEFFDSASLANERVEQIRCDGSPDKDGKVTDPKRLGFLIWPIQIDQ